ncbi:hypothetical protein FHS25_000749 [Rhizobium laguerreae]|uniref:Uncharacterized protein n=2 Tax=Rhizobium/Agrobacterium group TaxID=227290 RepID=A0ABR6G215_9HYPH|nr:hypothetical protein [Rhizobium laguerreae]MBB3160317.1 hypothetical protein [Rhizobium laguerreae]
MILFQQESIMVDAINPISATAASEPTKVGTSTSIGSEPDNAWVAARQSQITADQLAAKKAAKGLIPHADLIVENEEHPQKRHGHAASDDGEEAGEQAEQPVLSGESDRIGTRNFDDDTPFGERVAII